MWLLGDQNVAASTGTMSTCLRDHLTGSAWQRAAAADTSTPTSSVSSATSTGRSGLRLMVADPRSSLALLTALSIFSEGPRDSDRDSNGQGSSWEAGRDGVLSTLRSPLPTLLPPAYVQFKLDVLPIISETRFSTRVTDMVDIQQLVFGTDALSLEDAHPSPFQHKPEEQQLASLRTAATGSSSRAGGRGSVSSPSRSRQPAPVSGGVCVKCCSTFVHC